MLPLQRRMSESLQHQRGGGTAGLATAKKTIAQHPAKRVAVGKWQTSDYPSYIMFSAKAAMTARRLMFNTTHVTH